MNYEIEGTVTITVKIDVHADNEKSAKDLAKNAINSSYNLDVHGAYHNVNDGVEFDLDVFEE